MRIIVGSATRDWKQDSKGTGRMDFEMFADSIFELIDTWTDTVDEREYVALLQRITWGISSELPQSCGGKNLRKLLSWKANEDIAFDQGITQHEITMKDLIRLDEMEAIEAEEKKKAKQEPQPQPPAVEVVAVKRRKKKAKMQKAKKAEKHQPEKQISALPLLKGAARWRKAALMASTLLGLEHLEASSHASAMAEEATRRAAKMPLLGVKQLNTTIPKILRAKAQVDGKVREMEMEAQVAAVGIQGSYGPRKKQHRFDSFLVDYYTHQYGTKALAKRSVAHLFESVSKLKGIENQPRVLLFAKLCGVKIAEVAEAGGKDDGNGIIKGDDSSLASERPAEDGAENSEARSCEESIAQGVPGLAAYEFRPFAASDYVLPLLQLLVPKEADLDQFMGNNKRPVMIARANLMAAVRTVFKQLPEESPALLAFTKFVASRSTYEADIKEALAVKGGGTAATLAATAATAAMRAPRGSINGTISLGKNGKPRQSVAAKSSGDAAARRASTMLSKLRGRSMVALDEALLAALPLIAAEEAWRQWLHTITLVIVVRRWLRQKSGR
ncbi:unnamed protein product [Chrysoparadoxa australica]